MSADAPFDVGLQPERTALAWQRTALALSVAFLVTARLLAHESSSLALAVGGAGILVALALLAAGQRRYRTSHVALTSASATRVPFHSARPLLAWAALTLGLACGGLGAVIDFDLRG